MSHLLELPMLGEDLPFNFSITARCGIVSHVAQASSVLDRGGVLSLRNLPGGTPPRVPPGQHVLLSRRSFKDMSSGERSGERARLTLLHEAQRFGI